MFSEKEHADFFESAAEYTDAYKILANLVIEEVDFEKETVTPLQLSHLATLLFERRINNATARRALADLAGKGERNVEEYISERALWQIADEAALLLEIDAAMKENPKAAEDFKKGKKNAAKVLVGAVMKRTEGRADARLAEELVLEKLQS